MKRSNRLVLLVGIFLAVVAFVAIFIYLSGPGSPTPGPDDAQRNTTNVVVAAQDIPLGTQITEDLVSLDEDVPIDEVKSGFFASTNLVIGEVARREIIAGQQLTTEDFQSGSGLTSINCPPTLRCLAVQVDQVTGVGTLIRAGDYVDVVVGFTGDKFPVVTINPDDESITPVAGISGTTVKLLLQGLQVQGVLLPPPPAQDGQQGETPTDGDTPTNLTGQQEIVILGANAQQAEIIKFAQMDGNISLALRSGDDFRDPNDPTIPVTPVPDVTSGIILKELVDTYGVLVPEIIELILPEATAAP